MELTVSGLLSDAIADHPDRPVLILDEYTTTYRDLEVKSAQFARHLLAAGIGKGGRIGVMLPNDETFLISWLGAARIGAVAVTLPSLATAPEIARIAAHADLQMLVAPRHYLHHDYAARLEEAFPAIAKLKPPYRLAELPFLREVWLWCEQGADCPGWARRVDLAVPCGISADLLAACEASVRPADPAGIIYTSGSTAEPKGVIHSQASFIRAGQKLAASFDYAPGERAFASMPFFWVGGLTTTAFCLMTIGGTILASRKSGPELLDFIEAKRTTAVVSWPHIMRALADDPSFARRDWSAMRNGLFYQALPADRKPADPSLMATPIGMTETNGPYTAVDRHLTEEHRGSLGRLLPGVEARLVDPDSGAVLASWLWGAGGADSAGQVGLLHLRCDTMMLGMVGRETAEVFTADGWYVTGDLIEFKRGHIHYHGRADDMIKAHGANVSPREVEGLIAQMPGVAAVHAVGVPDVRRGTVVGAVVVPEPGCTLDPEAIRQAAARALASYKVPRVILICAASELPVLPASKIDRRALVKLLAEARRSDGIASLIA